MALISYPDRTLAAGLSGGSWSSTLNNLKDPLLSHVARSADALAASTQFIVDLGAAQTIRLLALCAHNISLTGTVRIMGYEDVNLSVLLVDTGVLPVWPEDFTEQNVAEYPINFTYVMAEATAARYWKVTIQDEDNAAGYIELGRCWIGDAAFEPAVGVSYGMSSGYESRDQIEESLGGVPWGQKFKPRRTLTATLSTITPAERRTAIVMQKVLTETDEAYWVTDIGATAEDMLIDAFPCFMRKPGPVTCAFFGSNEMPVSIIEQV